MKTVLVSVSDKTGLVELLTVMQTFEELRLIATSSTAVHLQEAGLSCETVESVTGFPEILEGRVKTLHPKVFGGILAKESVSHQSHLQAHQIPQVDMVIVNLYPFESVVRAGKPAEEVIENIDIGGVALIRAAAKNHQRVAVVSGRELYPRVIQELDAQQGTLTAPFRTELAQKAFEKTAYYDAMIATYFVQQREDVMLPDQLSVHFAKRKELRYGENPQDKAIWYKQANARFGEPFEQLQGKELSSNNIVDAHAAYTILKEFPKNPASCIIKHNNPCGVAIGESIIEAFEKAHACDPISAFGGIVAVNQHVSKPLAEKITENFVEIVMAPYFSEEALEVFAKKKNLRVLLTPGIANPHDAAPQWHLKDLGEFGLIMEEQGGSLGLPELTTVTEQPLPDQVVSDVSFAWAIVKHLTSNAIVVVRDGQTVGLGIGQTSRIASTEIALTQAGEKAQGAVLASDGFFPASDNIEAAADAGIAVVIQPGGSIKDDDVIQTADEKGLVMVLTHERCFKH